MLMVSTNLRKIATFLHDEQRQKPAKSYLRLRDVLKRSAYVRGSKNKRILAPNFPDDDVTATPADPPLRT